MLQNAGYAPQTQGYYGNFYDEATFLRAIGKGSNAELNCYFLINGHLADVEQNREGIATQINESAFNKEDFVREFPESPNPLFVETTKAALESVYIGKEIIDW